MPVFALLLQCGIFALFAFVGYGLATALVPERDSLRNVLLAPVLGAAAFTVPAVLLNHIGVPVGVSAWPLTLFLIVLAAAALRRRGERARVPWRALWPFLALLPAALVLPCRPLFEFGTDWLSFSNEDMINYASTAQRLLDYPFYAQPPALDVAGGGKLSQEGFWFHDVLGNERVGVDTLLALVSALARVRPFNAFMPFIGAGYFMLIWASAALGLARESRPRLALGIGVAVVLSSLTTLGVLYQLLGQVFGLAGLAASIAVLGDPGEEVVRHNAAGHIAFRVAIFAFVVAAYPELFPFVVLAALLEYVGVPLIERRRPDYLGGFAALLAAGLAFVVLWNYGLTMAHVIAARFASATGRNTDFLFPYFLLPSGFAAFWGLIALDYPPDPYMSVAIVAGASLLALQLVAILVASRAIQPAALTALVMTALGVAFFVRRDDFALFKMTMYVQPFFAASLALGAYALLGRLGERRREWTAAALTAAFALVGVGAQQKYVELSRSTPDATTYRFSQLPLASPRRLLSELDAAARKVAGAPVAIDAPLPEYAKLAHAYFADAPLATLSDDFLDRFRVDQQVFGVPDADDVREAARLEVEEFHNREQLAALDVPPVRRVDGTTNRFRRPWMPAGRPRWLLELGGDASVLNRSGDAVPDTLVALRPWESVHDHLVMLQSEAFGIDGWSGAWEDGAPRGKPMLYRPEHDVYGKGTFSGLGRYLAFDAVNPAKRVRLVLWASATLKADAKNLVPRGRVFGAQTVSLGGGGRGSARLVSEPFAPERRDGLSLVGLDLGEDGTLFRKPRTGLMRWFGSDIALDPRKLVVFARDLSLISDDDYRRWAPPSWIVDVPGALDDPHLAYSGIYEDAGWISEDAELTLSSDASTRRVRVEGLVPRVASDDFTTTAALAIDGVVRRRATLGVGTFALEAPVRLAPGKHRLTLTFSRAQRFPDPDNRLVAARLDAVGFPP